MRWGILFGTLEEMNEFYIVFFVFSCLGIVSSGFVIAVLLRYGNFKMSITYLLFWLHFSLLAEEITLLPLIFSYSNGLCVSTQFFHYYFGMMNLIVVLQLIEMHRYLLLNEFEFFRNAIQKYGTIFFVCFPSITSIPYFAREKGWDTLANDDTGWCVEPVDVTFLATMVYFYMWTWLFLFLCIVVMLYTAYRVVKTDHVIGKKYLSTVGLMLMISIISWIPRSINQFPSIRDHGNHYVHRLVSLLPVPICGICFGLLFYFIERPNLALFKDDLLAFMLRNSTTSASFSTSQGDTSSYRCSFSWETEELESSFNHNQHRQQESPDHSNRSSIISLSSSRLVQNPIKKNASHSDLHSSRKSTLRESIMNPLRESVSSSGPKESVDEISNNL